VKRGEENAMKKKVAVLTLYAMLFAPCFSPEAQQAKVPRIGLLTSNSRSANLLNIDAFRQGLRELGYVEGQNILLEHRYAEGDLGRVSMFASELVRLKVDVLVTGMATKAAKQATSTIPIVAADDGGALVEAGLIGSSRYAGNITGSTRISLDLGGKRIALLKETFPKIVRVALLLDRGTVVVDNVEFRDTIIVGRQLGVKVQILGVSDAREFPGAYAAMVKESVDAVIMSFGHKQLIELAVENRFPSMCEQAVLAEAGCLLSYGADVARLWRRAAVFVDKILKGSKPADLPVEQPTKFEFIINLKTAKEIGVTIPPNVLARADRVIK